MASLQGLFDVQPGMQMRETTAVKLDEICRELGVRLILVRSYGLVGSMRVSSIATLSKGSTPIRRLCTKSAYSGMLTLSFGLQASLVEHEVVESKPDNMVEDLRQALLAASQAVQFPPLLHVYEYIGPLSLAPCAGFTSLGLLCDNGQTL